MANLPGIIQLSDLANFTASSSTIGLVQLAGDLGGTATAPVVVGLRGVPVSITAPSANDVLTFNGTAWTATSLGGMAVGGDLRGSLLGATVVAIQGVQVSPYGSVTNGTSTSGLNPSTDLTGLSPATTAAIGITVDGLHLPYVTFNALTSTTGDAIASNLQVAINAALTNAAGVTTTESLVTSSAPIPTVTLAHLPINVPSIPGYSYTAGTPTSGHFTVNFLTGVLTLSVNAADTPVDVTYKYATALASVTVTYTGDPFYVISSNSTGPSSSVVVSSPVFTAPLPNYPDVTPLLLLGVANGGTEVIGTATAVPSGYVLTAGGGNTASWQTGGASTSTNALNTTSTPVDVSAAAAPTTGQVLTATSATTADWATPSIGAPGGVGGNIQFNSSNTFGGDFKLNWEDVNSQLQIQGHSSGAFTNGAIVPMVWNGVGIYGVPAGVALGDAVLEGFGAGNMFLAVADTFGVRSGIAIKSTSGTTKVGIGNTTPVSLLSVGSASQFQVDSSGNVLSVNNVTTNFPATQGAASTILTNDGSGNLSWTPSSSVPGTMTSYPLGVIPTAVAFDGVNMWSSTFGANVICKITPSGTVTTYSCVLTNSRSIAFDGVNMWITDFGSPGRVIKVAPNGTTTSYSGTGDNPVAIAFDGVNMWTANVTNSVSKIAPNGAITNYSPGGLSQPAAIAFDGVNMWVTNFIDGTIAKIAPDGTSTSYPAPGFGLPDENGGALVFDGVNMKALYSSGSDSRVVTIAPDGTSTVGPTLPVGFSQILCYDGTNLWTNASDGAHSIAVKIAPDGSTTTYTSQGPAGFLYHMAFDGENVWAISEADHTVVKIVTGSPVRKQPANLYNFAIASRNSSSALNGVAVEAPASTGQILTATSSSAAAWLLPSAAGVNHAIQFNNAGTFGATSNLTYDGATGTTGTLAIGRVAGTAAESPYSIEVNGGYVSIDDGSGTGSGIFRSIGYGESGGAFVGYSAAGTESAPTNTLNGDTLTFFGGKGYDGTSFTTHGSRAGITFGATEDWTSTAQGTQIIFRVTANGTVVNNNAMRLSNNGNLGIGVINPTSRLHVAGLPSYANNAAAIAGGMTPGAFYTDGLSDPRQVYVVF